MNKEERARVRALADNDDTPIDILHETARSLGVYDGAFQSWQNKTERVGRLSGLWRETVIEAIDWALSEGAER